MNRLSIALAFAALALVSRVVFAQGVGYPRTLWITYHNAPLYASADYMSEIVGRLRLGDSVIALGSAGRYFRVTYNGRDAYLLGANASLERAKPKAGAGRQGDRQGARPGTERARAGASPTQPAAADRSLPDSVAGARAAAHAAGDTLGRPGAEPQDAGRSRGAHGPAAGEQRPSGPADAAGRQCLGTTRSGKQCSRRTSDSTGYCWQHRKK